MACVPKKSNVPKKATRPRGRPAGLHPALLLQSCQDCYTNSTEREYKWWTRLCREPHLMVWAKFKNTRYWPAKAIATQKNKTVVFYFGKRIYGVVDSANCLMYSQHNPNRVVKKDLAWMYGFMEADDYICRLIEAHGCFRYAGPNRRFDAASIREHRREVFPDAFAYRFRAIAAVARGPVANARVLAANQERSASQSRSLAVDEDAQSMDTDEEVDVVTVDPPASPACQLSPPEELMSKEKHQMALEQLRIDHEKELARAKKLVWCSVCEEPAVMICCWSFFYCSEECFLRDSHRAVCRKPYMADHVTVARRSSPSILAPMLANCNIRQRAATVAGPSTVYRPRPIPYHCWSIVRDAPSYQSEEQRQLVDANRALESRPPYQVGSNSTLHNSLPMNDGQVDASAIRFPSKPFDKLEVLAYAASQFVKYSGHPPRS